MTPEAEVVLSPDDYRAARLGPANLRLPFGVVADRALVRERGSRRFFVTVLLSGWAHDRPVLGHEPGAEPHFFCCLAWPPEASSDQPVTGDQPS